MIYMPDIWGDFNNWLSSGVILGVPVIVFFIIVGLVAFVIFLLISRKVKIKEFKPINLRRQIKKDLNLLYGTFGEAVGKPLMKDGIMVGTVLGYMPLSWNEEISIQDNIKMNKNKEVVNVIEYIRKDKTVKILTDMRCLKVSSKSKLKKMVGLGKRYHIIKESQLTYGDIWNIDKNAQPSIFYDIIFYNTPARAYIEDIGFRINRENELQEISNAVPRVVFWDNEFAKRAMIERERASIEKEKFKGQKESAED